MIAARYAHHRRNLLAQAEYERSQGGVGVRVVQRAMVALRRFYRGGKRGPLFLGFTLVC